MAMTSLNILTISASFESSLSLHPLLLQWTVLPHI